MSDHPLTGLFQDHRLLRAVIEAVLEERGGRVLSMGPHASQAAVLEFGCYRIPGGDPGAPEARDLLSVIEGPCEIVVPDDDAWRSLIKDLIRGRMARPTSACLPCGSNCGSENATTLLSFDPSLGRVLIPLHSYHGGGSPNGWWIAAIEGFTTTFDIVETYQPTANEISFRVPLMPEGFQAADSFDTFYGDLSTVGDWSQAQPLECGYPAAAPSAGDYITVADTLPALKPGQGRYFVTAVTHQGETRYGRKSSGGKLTGRDPELLPVCE